MNDKQIQSISENEIKMYEIQHSILYPILSKCNFNYAILKGDTLSISAYGKTGYRTYNDIDILISKADIENVRKLFIDSGFENRIYQSSGTYRPVKRSDVILYAQSHQSIPFYKEVEGLSKPFKIDLNFDIYWGEYEGKRVKTEDILSDCMTMDIYGYKFHTLSYIKSFIQVCMHQYKHMYGVLSLAYNNAYASKSFQDIYNFFKRRIDSDITSFTRYIKEIELADYMYVVLFYVLQIYNDNSLNYCVRELETDTGKNMLEHYGFTDDKRKWKLDFFERLDNNNLTSHVRAEMNDNDKLKMDIYSNFD